MRYVDPVLVDEPARPTAAPSSTAEEFATLVVRYQDAAFAYAYALLQNRSAAEDATQAAFLTAWLHLSALRDRAAFGAWLRTIVRTECTRSVRATRLAVIPLDANTPEPAVDDANARELRLALVEAIATLSERDRIAVSLRYVSGLSYEEMADFLAVPVSTVKKRLHDARKRLRTQLESVAVARVPREWRPSSSPRLETQVTQLTALLDSVARGDLAVVKAMLDAHPEYLSARGALPRFSVVSATAMTMAALCGRADVVELLLSRGADPGSSSGGASAIALAAIEGRSNVVKLLLSRGVQPDVSAAAALGDSARIRALVEADASLVTHTMADGRTPLHFARSVDTAAVLLDAGADIDAKDIGGVTPLQWISATGRYKAVAAFLRSRGATAQSIDIFWACSFGDTATATRVLDADPSQVRARSNGGHGIARTWAGATPLHVAATRGEDDVVCLLIARSADVDARNVQGSTPLHGAAANGHASTIELLIAGGADRTIRDGTFNMPASAWAGFFGHAALAERLKT
jgi:RNA polymerase sigma factor (sigma-70 family)